MTFLFENRTNAMFLRNREVHYDFWEVLDITRDSPEVGELRK